MDTPCIDLCVLDAENRCIGCERTSDEIAMWVVMGPDRRRAVMAALERRRAERGRRRVNDP